MPGVPRRSWSPRRITACPCTLAYSNLELKAKLEAAGYILEPSLLKELPPTLTHSQPGALTVRVSGTSVPTHGAILKALDGVVHFAETLLKREDEHALVDRVHRAPQFCEDVCRAVGVAIAAIASRDALIFVRADLDESIHPHNATAELCTVASQLWCGEQQ